MERVKYLFEFLRNVIKKNPIIFLIAIVFPILSGYLTVYVYDSQVKLIDAVTALIKNGNIEKISIVAPFLFFLFINLSQLGINLIGKVYMNKFGSDLGWDFQEELVNIANRIEFNELNNREFNDKLARAKQVAENDLSVIIGNVIKVANLGCALFSIIVLAYRYQLYLCAVLITTMLFINIFIKVKTEIKVKKLNREMTFDGRVADYLSKTIYETRSIRELRIFRSENYFLELWKNKILHQNSVRYGARKLEIKMGIVVSVIQTITLFFILFLLISRINHNSNITIGLISVLFLNLIQCKDKIFDILWPICGLYLSAANVRDFNDVLSYKKRLRNEEIQNIDSPLPIFFKNVKFSYTPGCEVFKDLMFEVFPGEKIAIVGKNGAGKSTLIKLLLGLYKPMGGSISWNGKEQSSTRVSIVYQDYPRYDLTLRENITLSDVTRMHKDEDIVELIKKCGLYDLYVKLGGLDVPLGYTIDNGVDVSGGQWQRIAIARALFKEADLIIFDEPTAAIDPKSEVEIFKMLIELCAEKTAIFISHRLGWTRNCDRIVVLDDGKVAEQGKHEELLELRGIYHQMYVSQSEWYK